MRRGRMEDGGWRGMGGWGRRERRGGEDERRGGEDARMSGGEGWRGEDERRRGMRGEEERRREKELSDTTLKRRPAPVEEEGGGLMRSEDDGGGGVCVCVVQATHNRLQCTHHAKGLGCAQQSQMPNAVTQSDTRQGGE
eukprot:2223771-Rhodomonas_salina.1